ncbi:MATE family efflux transporter [Photobacterium leiognathi]|uniref:hypothetical protein n=1 Tax=Photobacterium leiognathi TaxID=553611 RepID=UPI002981CD4A|nr:hypothetical protein [Photobacterium leiognathi]
MTNNIKKLLSSNILSQFFSMFSIIIMTTNFNSKDISTYGYFFSLLSMLSICLSFRLENLIFQVKAGQYSKIFANSVILISLLLTSVVFSLSFIFDIDYVIKVSIIGGVAFAIFNILNNYLTRNGDITILASAKILRSAFELLLVTLCVLSHKSITFLMFSLVLSYFLSSLYIYIRAKVYVRFRKKHIKQTLLQYLKLKKYAKWDFPSSILSAFIVYMPQVIFNNSGNYLISSIYFMSSRYIGSPLLLIAQAIGLALKQEYQREKDLKIKNNASVLYIRKMIYNRKFAIAILLSFISIPIIYLIHPDYSFKEFFICFIILLPLYWARFIFNCFAGLVYVKGLFKENFIYQLLSTIILIGILYSFKLNFYTLLIYSLLSLLMYITFSFYVIRKNDD